MITKPTNTYFNQALHDMNSNATIDNIPISRMVPFRDHPFKVRHDEELDALKESIEKSGVLVPVLLRPHGDGYEGVGELLLRLP